MKPGVRKTIIIISTCLLIALVVFVGWVFYTLAKATTSLQMANVRDRWEIWYFVFSIVGALATVAAVYVAIFKEEILHLLNSPQLNVKSFEKVKISPVKNTQGQVTSYQYNLEIENSGTDQASDLTVSYVDFRYDTKRLRKNFDVVDVSMLNNVLESCSLSANDVLRVPLFNVINPGTVKDPRGENVNASISFKNVSVEEKATNMAVFQIKYRIRAAGVNDIFVVCEVDWSGVWSEDGEQMQNNITVKSLSK